MIAASPIRRSVLVVGFLLCASLSVCSQTTKRDTTSSPPPNPRLYVLDELVVTSLRIPSTARRSPAPVSLISRAEIEREGASSLGEILMAVPGISLKDYGAASGLKTISQRGMGTEHTLILLNGMPINNMLTGSLDFGSFPAEEVEQVEVVRGGQSASFGASAVAGVVNIVTRPAKSLLSTRLAAGSFGERDGVMSVGNLGEVMAWRVSGGAGHTDGDYPYKFSNGPVIYDLVRSNAESDSWRCSGDVSAALSPALRLKVSGLFTESRRGVAGVVTSPFSMSRASQHDQQGILQASLVHIVSLESWWETKVQGLYSYQQYGDPDIVVGGIAVNNNSRSTEGRAESQFHTSLTKGTRLTIGGDLAAARCLGNAISGEPSREELGIFAVGEQTIQMVPESVIVLSIQPALRYEVVSETADAFSPQIGFQLLMVPGVEREISKHLLRLHGSVGNNFRTPTFNELYYSGGGGRGNPNLRPERSTAYDLGVSLSLSGGGEHECDATLFYIDMSDRIIWTSAGSGSTTPKNLRSVVARGVEVSYGWRWSDLGLHLTASYTRSRTEKTSADYPGDSNLHTLVPYAPQEVVSWIFGWDGDLALGAMRACGFSISGSHVGFRYTSEDNTSYLPGYTVVKASVVVGFGFWNATELLRLDVRNLLNEEYQVMLGYPMPPRSYQISFELTM
jgi:vitamin B12 transporter